MKARHLLLIAAPLGAALAGCTVYRPVAVEPAVVTTPTVAVAPAVVTQPSTVIMGAAPAPLDSDGDGYANSIDRAPYDARFH